MTQVSSSTNNCYERLATFNGKFLNGLSFNFDKPNIFNEQPYQQALLGDLIISTRNHIGKYQGNYLLYITDGNDFIRLKIKSQDNSCALSIELTDKEKSKATIENDAIIMKFDDFISLLSKNKLLLK